MSEHGRRHAVVLWDLALLAGSFKVAQSGLIGKNCKKVHFDLFKKYII